MQFHHGPASLNIANELFQIMHCVPVHIVMKHSESLSNVVVSDGLRVSFVLPLDIVVLSESFEVDDEVN